MKYEEEEKIIVLSDCGRDDPASPLPLHLAGEDLAGAQILQVTHKHGHQKG